MMNTAVIAPAGTINIGKAVDNYMHYLIANKKPNSVKNIDFTLSRFRELFGDDDISSVHESDVAAFLDMITEGNKPATKCTRVTSLRAFYNFTAEWLGTDIPNPCNKPAIKRVFKAPRHAPPKIYDKEVIDEIIFRTTNERDRLMLELMGRAAMRVGEVLSIRPRNLSLDMPCSLALENPKSGRSGEKVILHQKLARKVDDYIRKNNIHPDDRIFSISYSTVFRTVRDAGKLVGVKLAPHDLRRHAATFASRGGTPLEIVSKVILRHADLATTQRYLGEVSETEAYRWIEQINN